MNQKNVLLLVVDTLRPERLGCYGSTGGLSPNIDRLANEGARFTEAITSGTWTQAAMPGILTSTYASMYNGCLGPLAAERPSPVEAIAKAGFQTGAFISNPLIGKKFNYDRGFSVFKDIKTGEIDPPLRKRRGGQVLLRSRIFQSIGKRFGADLRPARVYPPGETIVNTATDWACATQTPFFGWLHFMDVHWPYHLDKNVRKSNEIADAWRDLHHFHEAGWRGGAFTEQHRQHYTKLYDKSLQYLDTQVGRLIVALEECGRLEDTIIILTADHGEEFLEHGRWGHWEDNLHDEILRVPLIVWNTDSSPCVLSRPVQTLDILPTILDLLSVPPPEGMVGRSLRDLIDDPERPNEDRVTITEMRRKDWHKIALRTSKYKYIWDNRQPDRPVVYDLARDSGETKPLGKDSLPDWQRFQGMIDAHLATVTRSASQTSEQPPEADEEMLDRLRRLGYIE